MSGQTLTPERLLGKALILRAKVAEALKKAAELPAEARTPPKPLTRESVYQQICAVWYAINEARAKSMKLQDDKVKLEILEKAERLQSIAQHMLARFEQAANAAARKQLLKQLEELRAEVKTSLMRLRLVPGVVTV